MGTGQAALAAELGIAGFDSSQACPGGYPGVVVGVGPQRLVLVRPERVGGADRVGPVEPAIGKPRPCPAFPAGHLIGAGLAGREQLVLQLYPPPPSGMSSFLYWNLVLHRKTAESEHGES